MTVFLNILAIIGAVIFMVFFFGSCVFVHELGHFLAAKLCKLHIDAFSVGFRPMWHKKVNGIDYRIGYLPFGGYCELPQIDSSDEIPHSADGQELPRAKPWARLVTAFAGPFFNILYGLFIGCFVWLIGMPIESPRQTEIEVVELQIGSPEYQAGLRDGDIIVKLNGEEFKYTFKEFATEILTTIGQVRLEIVRDGAKLQIEYQPVVNPNAPGMLRHEAIAWPFFRGREVLMINLQPESLLAKAGIQNGDIMVKIDDTPLLAYSDFWDYTASKPNPECYQIQVKRGTELLTFVVPVVPDKAAKAMIGIMFSSQTPQPQIVDLNRFGQAVKAGLQKGDVILAADGQNLATKKLIEYINQHAGQSINFTIRRGENTLNLPVTPLITADVDFGVSFVTIDHPTPFAIFVRTLQSSFKSLRSIVVSAGNQMRLTDQVSTISAKHMSGPFNIIIMLFLVAYYQPIGVALNVVAFISFALAIFNLLPLPVLDGGHIAFALIEIIFRRPLPTVVVRYLTMTFIVLLIALMLFVTVFDLKRLGYMVGVLDDRTPDAPKIEAAK